MTLHNTTLVPRLVCAVSLLLISTFALAEPAVFLQKHRHLFQSAINDPDITTIVGWDSHYVTEGRDNLSGEGLSSFTTEVEIGGFLFGAWLTQNGDVDYDEQNYYVEYGFNFHFLDLNVGYNHLQLQSDGEVDNEAAFGVSIPDFPCGLTPALDWYYSFDADGAFYEFSLSRECEITDRTTLVPALIFGINDGYIPDGHNGANHVALQLGLSHKIRENLSLDAFVTQTLGIDSNPRLAGDTTLIDLLYGSVAVSWKF